MATNRPPSKPPEIPGFSHQRLLGAGGFSDVFLYSQHLPRRQVAVKVLLAPAADTETREQFVAEANLMAELSTHPSIVTIYHADTAVDGRPYLMMEYCPRPNLSVRYRSERMSVAESMRIGIRLAGAVETAHRAGILHRDIKPANVLTTDYGWPALTDFGISVVSSAATDSESVGMSIPWSAPEFFSESSERGPAGDIYALAATVYTLLAGRSPFEQQRGKNSALELITRIENDPVPPIGREDIPAALMAALSKGLAKDPARRFASAAEFARAMQRVEQELQLALTSLDLPDTSWMHVPDNVGEDLRTRVRSVVEITPQVPAQPEPAPAADRTRLSGVLTPEPDTSDDTMRRAAPLLSETEHEEQPPAPATPLAKRRWLMLAGSAAVVLIVLAVVVIGALNAPDDPPPTPTATTSSPEQPSPDTQVRTPPEPQNLQVQRGEGNSDEVLVSWDAPEFDGELEYAWSVPGDSDFQRERISETQITLSGTPGTVCVEIAAIATDTDRVSEWIEGCA